MREIRTAPGARWVAVALAGCATVYLSWLPASLLVEGQDPLLAYVSELHARGEPLSGQLRAADCLAGLMAMLCGGAGLAWLCPADRRWEFRVGWASLIAFGLFTVADSALPMACSPSADQVCRAAEDAGALPIAHYAHTVTSSLAAAAALVFLLCCYLAARRGVVLPRWRRWGPPLLGSFTAVTGWVVVAALWEGWPGLAQRIQLLLLFGCFAALVADTALLPPAPAGPAPPPGGRLVPAGDLGRPGTARLHLVQDGPPDGTPVVLLSGLGESWFGWDAVTAGLAGTHRVIRFDRPGLGYSDLEPGAPQVAREADRVAAALTAAGAGGPAVVVGHSLGAVHAEAFARLYPEHTAALVLVDPSQTSTRRPARAPVGALPPATGSATGRAAAVRAWAAAVLGAVLTAVGVPLLAGVAMRSAVLAATSMRRRPARSAHASRVYGSARCATGVLREYLAFGSLVAGGAALRAHRPLPPVPVRILAATGRMATRRSRHRWLAGTRALAGALGQRATVVVLPDSGHHVPGDRPDAVVDAVLSLGTTCPRTAARGASGSCTRR